MKTDYREANFDARIRTLKEIKKAENKHKSRVFLKPVITPISQAIKRDELERAKQEAKYMSELELMKAREQARKYLPTINQK